MNHEIKFCYRGVGAIYQLEGPVSQVFYSFQIEDIRCNSRRVFGVAITRRLLPDPNGCLILESEEGQTLNLLSLEPILPPQTQLGIYRFTAEFTETK
jgi:hypothetical protein